LIVLDKFGNEDSDIEKPSFTFKLNLNQLKVIEKITFQKPNNLENTIKRLIKTTKNEVMFDSKLFDNYDENLINFVKRPTRESLRELAKEIAKDPTKEPIREIARDIVKQNFELNLE